MAPIPWTAPLMLAAVWLGLPPSTRSRPARGLLVRKPFYAWLLTSLEGPGVVAGLTSCGHDANLSIRTDGFQRVRDAPDFFFRDRSTRRPRSSPVVMAYVYGFVRGLITRTARL